MTKAEFAFEYDYYELPKITEAQLKNNVELSIEASFTSKDGYGEWVSARPELLLLLVSWSCLWASSAWCLSPLVG